MDLAFQGGMVQSVPFSVIHQQPATARGLAVRLEHVSVPQVGQVQIAA